jgi:TolB-like protein/tetratricopeptide (TPR) repeat protein
LKLFQELQRRNVFRVGIAYAVAGWVLLQVGDLVLENIEAPAWVIQAMMLVVALGFIAALIIAWAYELTPEGIKRDRDVERGQSIMHETGRKLDRIIMGFLLVAVAYFAVDKFVLDLSRDAKPVLAEPPIIIDIATPVAGFSGRAAIAVIPFVNMSNDPDQEYFADGITEDLITGLQSFQSFPIIARTSTFQYKGTSPDVREIAAALGAGYIVEGSVRKVNDEVRINVQLNDRHGQHVWAENYDFEFKDVLRIQSELVSKVMLAIEPELIISEADRTRFVRTEDMEAFDYFLRAATNTFASFAFTDLNGEVVTPERLELAREYATKAVELDPKFAAAWRMLNHIEGSYAVNYAYLFSEQELKEKIERGIEYGQRSRLLSPFEPTVCSCLAAMLLMSGDVEGARLLQEESLKQNPSSAIVHAVMAKILQVSGDDERALEEITLAKRLSPEDMAMTTFLYFEAAIYQDLGRFSEAVAAANLSLLTSPLNYDAEFVKITSLYASGQRELARAAIVRLKASSPPDFQPVSGWSQPFAESVADSVTLANGMSLHGLRYNDGLRLVFEDLGWDTE